MARSVKVQCDEIKNLFKQKRFIGQQEYCRLISWMQYLDRHFPGNADLPALFSFINAQNLHQTLVYPFTEVPGPLSQGQMKHLATKIQQSPGFETDFSDRDLFVAQDAALVGGKRYLDAQVLAAKNRKVGKNATQGDGSTKVTMTNGRSRVIPTGRMSEKSTVTVSQYPLALTSLVSKEASLERVRKLSDAIFNDIESIYGAEDDNEIKRYVQTWLGRLQTFEKDISRRLDLMTMLHAMVLKRLLIAPFAVSWEQLTKMGKVQYSEVTRVQAGSFQERMQGAFEAAMMFKEEVPVDPLEARVTLEHGVSDQLNLLMLKKFLFMPEIRSLLARLRALEGVFEVLRDITEVLLDHKFLNYVSTAFGNKMLTVPQARALLSDIACCSLMRLDTNSMDKLWELMVMIFKWQLFVAKSAQNLLDITFRHLDGVARIMPEVRKSIHVDGVKQILIDYWDTLNDGERGHIVTNLNQWVKPFNTKISILIRLALQKVDGSFVETPQSNAFFDHYCENLGTNIYAKTAHLLPKDLEQAARKPSLEPVPASREFDLLSDQLGLGLVTAPSGSSGFTPNLADMLGISVNLDESKHGLKLDLDAEAGDGDLV